MKRWKEDIEKFEYTAAFEISNAATVHFTTSILDRSIRCAALCIGIVDQTTVTTEEDIALDIVEENGLGSHSRKSIW